METGPIVFPRLTTRVRTLIGVIALVEFCLAIFADVTRNPSQTIEFAAASWWIFVFPLIWTWLSLVNKVMMIKNVRASAIGFLAVGFFVAMFFLAPLAVKEAHIVQTVDGDMITNVLWGIFFLGWPFIDLIDVLAIHYHIW